MTEEHWTPKVGEQFFSVSPFGKVMCHGEFDRDMIVAVQGLSSVGNCYPTYELAEQAAERVQRAYSEEKSNAIYALLAEMFDTPCNFTFNGEDVSEFMTTVGGNWCDEHCGDLPEYAKCWREYMRLMLKGKEIENAVTAKEQP